MYSWGPTFSSRFEVLQCFCSVFSDHLRHLALCLKGLYFTSTIRSKVAVLSVITKVKLWISSNTVVTMCQGGLLLLRLCSCKVRQASTWSLKLTSQRAVLLFGTHLILFNCILQGMCMKIYTHTHKRLYWCWVSSCPEPGLCGWRHHSKSLVYA